eukprot:6176804-Pleurochrysis_carterae.AAC.1
MDTISGGSVLVHNVKLTDRGKRLTALTNADNEMRYMHSRKWDCTERINFMLVEWKHAIPKRVQKEEKTRPVEQFLSLDSTVC